MLRLGNALHGLTAALLLAMAVIGGPAWAQQLDQAEAVQLAIKGHDPVAYFTDGRPLVGRAEFQYTWDEARYRFASAQHLTLFRTDPDRYVPQFAGSCAMAMSKGMKIEANPENWLISNGRLFVFASSDSAAKFAADPDRMVAAGDANWQQLKDAPIGTRLVR
jgi:YHS domain-containing protein